MPDTMYVTGMDAFKRVATNLLNTELAGRTKRKAALAGAREFEMEMKATAPESPKPQSFRRPRYVGSRQFTEPGRIRRSIGTRFSSGRGRAASQKNVVFKVGMNVGKKKSDKRRYAPHGHFPVLGTTMRFLTMRGGGARRGKVPTRKGLSQFIRRAGEVKADAATARIEAVMYGDTQAMVEAAKR